MSMLELLTLSLGVGAFVAGIAREDGGYVLAGLVLIIFATW